MEAIHQVLEWHKQIDMESFLGYFYLWRYVSTRLPLPLPPLERIVPFTISQWSSVKGGSETITKLLWLNMYDPPCTTPQSCAIGRMLLLGTVLIHHLNHFFTSKDNLKQSYHSLQHFQKAASNRSSFHETLLLIVHSIKQRTATPALAPSPSNASAIEGILTRRNDTRTMTVSWGTTSTGITPKKSVNQWYKKNPTKPAEILLHNRMKECRGAPVYRVNVQTKGKKGTGSRGCCAE
jgi:hypothetical protein